MAKLVTVHTAKPSDIWPDGSGYSREVEDEIIKIARTEISADDVARSGLVFAEWYKFFYLAEGRWRLRQEQQAEQKKREHVTKSANARNIARLEKKLAAANGNLAALNKVIFGVCKNGPDADPMIIKLIRGVCWELMIDKRAMRDAGVWNEAKRYAPGAAVTYQGAIWTCQKEHENERPPGASWRLAVKSDIAELKRTVREELARMQKDHGK